MASLVWPLSSIVANSPRVLPTFPLPISDHSVRYLGAGCSYDAQHGYVSPIGLRMRVPVQDRAHDMHKYYVAGPTINPVAGYHVPARTAVVALSAFADLNR